MKNWSFWQELETLRKRQMNVLELEKKTQSSVRGSNRGLTHLERELVKWQGGHGLQFRMNQKR